MGLVRCRGRDIAVTAAAAARLLRLLSAIVDESRSSVWPQTAIMVWFIGTPVGTSELLHQLHTRRDFGYTASILRRHLANKEH